MVNVLIRDKMTDQGQSLFSSWLDSLPLGTEGAVWMDRAGAAALAVGGGGPAVSRVPACCLPSCLRSSCGSLRGPTSLAGAAVPCCCGACEDFHDCCPSARSGLLVPLDNHCWCRLGCGMSVWSCDASCEPQTAALYRPKFAAAAGGPLRCSCPEHGSLVCPPCCKDGWILNGVMDCALLGIFLCGSRADCLQEPIVLC